MAIEKNRPEDEETIDIELPEIEMKTPEGDIEIILEEDGGATVEMGEKDHEEVPFDANLAEVVDPSELDVGVGRGKRGLGCCRQVDLPTAREQTDHRITDVLWRDDVLPAPR